MLQKQSNMIQNNYRKRLNINLTQHTIGYILEKRYCLNPEGPGEFDGDTSNRVLDVYVFQYHLLSCSFPKYLQVATECIVQHKSNEPMSNSSSKAWGFSLSWQYCNFAWGSEDRCLLIISFLLEDPHIWDLAGPQSRCQRSPWPTQRTPHQHLVFCQLVHPLSPGDEDISAGDSASCSVFVKWVSPPNFY